MSVRVDVEGPVAVVTLARAEKRNAFDPAQTAALDEAVNRLDDDPGVRVVVLAAEGHVFSAGTDLSTGSGGRTERGGHYGICDRERETPVIAAVEGPAVGGGFEVVLACDLVVASTSATFSLPEVSRGLVATCGALFRAPRALGPAHALELLLTGDSLTAERAYELGIINRLVEPSTAVATAKELGRRISLNSPSGVRATLRAVRAATRSQDLAGWEATEAAARAVLASPDAAEGKLAFIERRPPRWT